MSHEGDGGSTSRRTVSWGAWSLEMGASRATSTDLSEKLALPRWKASVSAASTGAADALLLASSPVVCGIARDGFDQHGFALGDYHIDARPALASLSSAVDGSHAARIGSRLAPAAGTQGSSSRYPPCRGGMRSIRRCDTKIRRTDQGPAAEEPGRWATAMRHPIAAPAARGPARLLLLLLLLSCTSLRGAGGRGDAAGCQAARASFGLRVPGQPQQR